MSVINEENIEQYTDEMVKLMEKKIAENNNTEMAERVESIDGKIDVLLNRADNMQDQLTSINEKLRIETDITPDERYVYGIRRKLTDNTVSAWERIEDNVGLVANAKKETLEDVQNDFDHRYPWSAIQTCNIDIDGNITAYIGEPDFKFDGSNGEVMTRIPTHWVKREIITDTEENRWEYRYIATYAKEGFTKVKNFLLARYTMNVSDDLIAHSVSGVVPKTSTNIATFRNYAKNLSTDYCLMDWRIFVIQNLYLVEYADYNSQNCLGNGNMSYVQAKTLIEEENTNRFIINNAMQGFYVGKTISIGATGANNSSVAWGRQILAINDYASEDGSTTGKEIVFDGEPVNIVTNNTIWGSPQISGDCDVLGMYSGCVVNDNYHSMIYRGLENIFANIWQHVDGINIQDRQAYICYNPADYVSDFFAEPYQALGYINASTSGYAKELGYDAENSLIAMPVEVGASSSTGTCDNYYQGTGNRIACVGGNCNDGLSDGLFSWNCSVASNNANINCGARLLKYQ